MKIAVVVVHYHTPHLLPRALRALQEDADRSSSLELEGVVVDNGSRPQDAAQLSSLGFRVIAPGSNLGYAGGVNLGLQSTTADLAVVMNPDVEVLPGCLSHLVDALEEGASVAGPRFFWDAERTYQLPPTETVGRFDELLRVLADGGDPWCGWARRRWRRHARRQFLAAQNLVSYDLSGALLALRREAWRTVGKLDESYPLYFEETDWLQRMRRASRRCCFVPKAEAVHLYAQSTVREGRAQQWFATSQRRFRQRFYGHLWTRALERLASGRSSPGPVAVEDETVWDVRLEGNRGSWIEVAASAKGFPAALRHLPSSGAAAAGKEALSLDIRRRMAPGTYFLRTVDDRGREGEPTPFEIQR